METAVSVGVWKEIETRTHQWEREGESVRWRELFRHPPSLMTLQFVSGWALSSMNHLVSHFFLAVIQSRLAGLSTSAIICLVRGRWLLFKLKWEDSGRTEPLSFQEKEKDEVGSHIFALIRGGWGGLVCWKYKPNTTIHPLFFFFFFFFFCKKKRFGRDAPCRVGHPAVLGSPRQELLLYGDSFWWYFFFSPTYSRLFSVEKKRMCTRDRGKLSCEMFSKTASLLFFFLKKEEEEEEEDCLSVGILDKIALTCACVCILSTNPFGSMDTDPTVTVLGGSLTCLLALR